MPPTKWTYDIIKIMGNRWMQLTSLRWGALLISGYLLPDNDDEESTKNNSKIE